MSHYRVAVYQTEASSALDTLMAPYSEHLEVEPYIDMTCEEAIEAARQRIAESQRRIDDGYGTEYSNIVASHANDEDDALLDWYAEWCGVERDENGNFLSTYNPKSKYDYYGEIETLAMGEWLATGAEEEEDELRREWKVLSTKGDGFYNKLYYLHRYGDEDLFVKACRLPVGWAVVTPDGEWHEPGKVGWFGTDDATTESYRDWVEHFEERFVKPYEGEGVSVTILDCHI